MAVSLGIQHSLSSVYVSPSLAQISCFVARVRLNPNHFDPILDGYYEHDSNTASITIRPSKIRHDLTRRPYQLVSNPCPPLPPLAELSKQHDYNNETIAW